MKITPSSPPQGPKLLLTTQPRQLRMMFEMTWLLGITTQQREAVIQALAVVLQQAAGLPVKEVDDERP